MTLNQYTNKFTMVFLTPDKLEAAFYLMPSITQIHIHVNFFNPSAQKVLNIIFVFYILVIM